MASLDAPTVAVVWSLAFAWAAQIALPVWIPILLALATWAVYVVDRLLDARRGFRAPRVHRLRERHRFHWRYRRVLLPSALAAACGAGSLIIGVMPRAAMERNFVLASVTLAYFTSVHTPRESGRRAFSFRWPFEQLFFPVELFIACVFTTGCLLPVFCRLPAAFGPSFAGLCGTGAFYVMVAWLNSYSIRCWESANGTPSRVFVAGCTLGGAGFAGAWLLSSSQPRMGALVAMGCVSALLLAFLHRLRNRLTPLTLRACADLVLLAPLALLLR